MLRAIVRAMTGTERLSAGPVPRPRRVHVTFGEPIPVADRAPTPEAIRASLW